MKETTKINLRNHAMSDQTKQDNTVSKSRSNVAKPLPVIGGMAIIVNQRHSECKGCKWHPDVCQYCELVN